MSDLKLGRNGDLDFSSKRAHLVGGANAVAQQIRIRFRMFLGEWFFDRTAGFPWFQQVLQQKGDVQRFEGLFRQVIFSTPKVTGIESFSFAFERSTRTLRLTFRAKTSEGVLDFDDEFDLEGDEAPESLTARSTWQCSSSAVGHVFQAFEPVPEHYWKMDEIQEGEGGDPNFIADEGSAVDEDPDDAIPMELGDDMTQGDGLFVEGAYAPAASVSAGLNDVDIGFLRSEPFSFAAWLSYTDRSPVGTVTFITAGPAALEVRDSPRRLFAFYDNETEFVPSVNDDVGEGPETDEFHLFVLTSGAGALKWYVDGALVKTQIGNIWTSSGLLFLMSLVGSGLSSGKWGQAALWRDRVLTAGEILSLADRGADTRIR